MSDANGELEDESSAFVDALNGCLDGWNRRLVNVIDNRFRSHRRRILTVEQQIGREILPLLREIRLGLRLVAAAIAALPALLGALRLLGLV